MATQKALFFALIITVPLSLTAISNALPEHLRATFFSLSRPFLLTGESLRDIFSGGLAGVKKLVLLYHENEHLKKELDLLERDIVQLREQEKENERLRTLLAFKSTVPQRSISCRVIARDESHLSHWILLDKGSVDGLKKEMTVVTERGLVGKVVEVGPRTARVIVHTDVEFRVSGLLQGSRATGLVTGEGAPHLKMKFIEVDTDIPIGEAVLSSGLGGVFPKGILIGEVKSVGREKNGLYRFAKIKPAVSLSRLEEVLCLDYPAAGSG